MLTELLLFLITILGLNTPGQILSTLTPSNAVQLEKPIFFQLREEKQAT